jgi:NMD protein affecting ribosome stability and mRNA decay
MDGRCCSCGARLNRISTVRSLNSPCLRMFMSIRTMTSLPSDGKVCNACRHLYHKWKKENPEFSVILTRLEGSMGDTNDIDDNSVNIFFVCLNIFNIFFIRLMLWMFIFKLMIRLFLK